MIDIIFEWDDRKAQQTEQKHGISFEEAQTAFYDENAQLAEHHCAPITASNAWRHTNFLKARYRYLAPLAPPPPMLCSQ